MYNFYIYPEKGKFFSSRERYCISYAHKSRISEVSSIIFTNEIYLFNKSGEVILKSSSVSFFDKVMLSLLLQCPIFIDGSEHIRVKRCLFSGNIHVNENIIKNSRSDIISNEMYYYSYESQRINVSYSGVYIEPVIAVCSFLFFKEYLQGHGC